MVIALRHRPSLGQFTFGGLTSGVAESIVKEAEGPTRRIIQEERTKVADAMIGGLAWLSAAALTGIGTYYLVDPKSKGMKFAGYGSAAALSGAGAIMTAANLRDPATDVKPGQTSGSIKSVSDQAAASMVAAAEPKIRAIINEERVRVSESVQAGLPLAAGGALAGIVTAMMLGERDTWTKVAGYSAAVLLAAGGAWIALDRVKS